MYKYFIWRLGGPPSLPCIFSNLNFERIGVSHKIEEETFPDYLAGRYYPMCIGEVLVFY